MPNMVEVKATRPDHNEQPDIPVRTVANIIKKFKVHGTEANIHRCRT